MRPPTDLRTNTTKRRMEQYKYSQSHKNAAAALYQEEKPSMPSGLETLLNDITAWPLKKGPIDLYWNVSAELPFYTV